MNKMGKLDGVAISMLREMGGLGSRVLPAHVRALIGKKMEDGDWDRLCAEYPGARHQKPGYCYTMDFRPERLNVHSGADGVVADFTWG